MVCQDDLDDLVRIMMFWACAGALGLILILVVAA
jgi:hypothetical protein